MKYPHFGSVSHGTMLTEDLLPCFLNVLKDMPGSAATYDALIAEAEECEDYATEEAAEIVNDLMDALNEYAPPYGYFGAHPGDGSDYGFWLDEEFQQRMRDDGVLELGAGDEVPEDELPAKGKTREVLFINDHGNAEFGYVDDAGKFTEVWSVV
jgi:hypothetical protein